MGNNTGFPIKRIDHSSVKSSFNPLKSLSLQNLLHVPSITKNLISVSKFARDISVYFKFHPNYCLVKYQDTKETLLQGAIRSDGPYCFQKFHPQQDDTSDSLVCNTHTVELSHPKLG